MLEYIKTGGEMTDVRGKFRRAIGGPQATHRLLGGFWEDGARPPQKRAYVAWAHVPTRLKCSQALYRVK